MKTLLSLLFLSLLFTFDSERAQAQYRANDELHAGHQKYDDPARRSPNRSAETAFGSGHATIEWGAPSVRDRQLYGRLIPSESIWRTGANEATVIHFDDDVLIEGEPLAAGSYALFTIGAPEEWTFIFNSLSQQWGSFSRNPDEDVLRVTVTPTKDENQEEMLFAFIGEEHDSRTLQLRWGTIAVDVNIELTK